MDGSQKEGGNFLKLLQKEGVPRKREGSVRKGERRGRGGGVPNLEETMVT